MLNDKMSVLAIVLMITTVINKGYTQDINSQTIRVMFYNVENLFDTVDDTIKDDDDFLPSGIMRWNNTRYNKKINGLYKTIVAAGEWSPPEIIAFCEVENKKVLEDLIYGTYLSKFNYRIIHEDSPDQRGIDVCIIYKKESVKIIDYHYWIPQGIKRDEFTSRSILYAKIIINSDTVHLFVNHWPSRRGGVLAGESMRLKIAAMVREKADSLLGEKYPAAKIIILGDFNSTPDDQEMKVLTSPRNGNNNFVNLSERISEKGVGTYRYSGTWEMIDQVIVSEWFLLCGTGLYTDFDKLRIFNPSFLLTNDPKFPGFTPFSTYRGFRYRGGFSDHLPVLLDLNFREQDQQE